MSVLTLTSHGGLRKEVIKVIFFEKSLYCYEWRYYPGKLKR